MRQYRKTVETPTHRPTLTGDFWVPAAQASFSGVLVGLAVMLWHGEGKVWVFALSGTLAALGVWAFLLLETVGDSVKTEVTVEVQQQEEVAQPAPGPTLSLEVHSERSLQILNVPVSAGQLPKLGQLLLEGSVDERSVKAAGITAPAWRQLRGELLRAGMLAWRSPNSRQLGLTVTPTGAALGAEIINGDAVPLLTDGLT